METTVLWASSRDLDEDNPHRILTERVCSIVKSAEMHFGTIWPLGVLFFFVTSLDVLVCKVYKITQN